MIKSLLSGILFILTTTLFCISGWSQQNYTIKRVLGKPNWEYATGITVDKQGSIYVSSDIGGIMKIDSNGFYQSALAYISEGTDKSMVKPTVLDESGNVWIADSYNNQVVKFDSRGDILLKFGSKGTGNGQFNYPTGITIDRQGNIWIADQANNRIQKFDANGKFLLKVGSLGEAIGQFNYPWDIETDSQDNVWVVDTWNNRLQKFDKNGVFLMTFGTFGSDEGQFNYPNGIAIDYKGNIWVTNISSYRIQKYDANGKFIKLYGSPGLDNDQFNRPQDITIDPQGNTWVIDSWNNRIQKFDAEGSFLLTIGFNGSGDAQLSSPFSLTTDLQGNVWITDKDNSSVKKFDPNGRFLVKFGSKGTGDGQFGSLTGIAIDPQGNIWVADPDNYRIQKFDKNGKFLLKVGSFGLEKGQFVYPSSLTTDSQGNIWVTDPNVYRIQKFDPNGKFLVEINSSNPNLEEYFYASGIETDSDDNLWIADPHRPCIYKFDANGKFLLRLTNMIGLPTGITVAKSGDLYCLSQGTGVIVYSTNEKSFILGKVYSDKNQNCSFDASDEPLSDIMLVANPGGYYSSTDKLGNYRIVVPVGTYTVSQVLNADNVLLQPTCPVTNVSEPVTLVKEGDQVTGINFANNATAIPHLEVSVSSTRRRRCFASTTVVNYSNTGYASASNVKVYVKMPKYIILKSANKPYIIDSDSNYVFSIDSLNAKQSGTIYISDSVACIANIWGLTACTKVWISPANNYTLPDNSQWDHSDVVLTGKCIENGRVQMVIKNIGQAMVDSAEFRVMLNAQLAFRKNYKLESGDSLVLKVPANGKTVRLEADQRPNHPRKSQTNLTIEGCIASTSDVVSKGFVDILPQDDVEPEVAIQCMRIVDSYDPNDKLVSPAGTANEHYTPTGSELKYTIRFQNTGTDYAYKVVVVDTLSENLDIATLQMGAASHSYSLKVSGKGRPVLTWTFTDINLPDSTRDQKGSNGFIQFSIKPKDNLPEKTLIENYADIFFDYNDPVRTNATANVMYDVPKVIDAANQLDESIIDKVMAAEPDALKGKLSLYPNPTQSQVWIQSVDASVRIEQVKLYNLLGEAQTVSQSSVDSWAVQINMQAKPKGMYLVHIQTNKGTSIQRVVVQ
ncbi:6-bladed beta-propeller [Cytophagaceae bacterium YF14B1]|uniref:6-bladed beta-propeller n=1 Tax=Xanthocytophaga flava TaxID=3048013 RepID=A0AAE3QSJ8_9BACT|nr:6-bladed beta-propeller [Xanthocytophaga flavus]MDJ1484642.1 6-bladed beta-propeller [Xanthocytophaga flavus]